MVAYPLALPGAALQTLLSFITSLSPDIHKFFHKIKNKDDSSVNYVTYGVSVSVVEQVWGESDANGATIAVIVETFCH